MAGLLERYDLMQKRPFGTNTALSDGTQYGVGGAVGSQYRRQEAAYGQALRLLNRQARRGDVRSALSAIDVRNQAMEGGYAPGGIRRKEQADAGIMGRIGAMDARNRGLEAAAQTMRQDTAEKLGVQGASGVQGATRVEGASGVQGASRDGYPGNPVPRAGYAPTAVSRTPNEVTTAQWAGQQPNFANPQDYELSGLSFSEAEREKRRRLTLDGAFGELPKTKMELDAERASGILGRADARLKRFGTLA